jgi:hypothetical protein
VRRFLAVAVLLGACTKKQAPPAAAAAPCVSVERRRPAGGWASWELRDAVFRPLAGDVPGVRVCGVLSAGFEQAWLRTSDVTLEECSAQARREGPRACLTWGALEARVRSAARKQDGRHVCLLGTLSPGRFRTLDVDGVEVCEPGR